MASARPGVAPSYTYGGGGGVDDGADEEEDTGDYIGEGSEPDATATPVSSPVVFPTTASPTGFAVFDPTTGTADVFDPATEQAPGTPLQAPVAAATVPATPPVAAPVAVVDHDTQPSPQQIEAALQARRSARNRTAVVRLQATERPRNRKASKLRK